MTPRALHREVERVAGGARDGALHVGEVANRAAVDRQHHVAGLEAGALGRAAGLHRRDPGRHLVAAGGVDARRRPRWRGGSSRSAPPPRWRPLPDVLGVEADRVVGRIHARHRVRIRHAGAVHVADELDVAAERDRRDLPAGAAAVVEADQLGSEADREAGHPDAAPPPDQEMAHLVDEHHDGEDEQERHDVAEQVRRRTADDVEQIHGHLDAARRDPPWPASRPPCRSRTIQSPRAREQSTKRSCVTLTERL